MWYQNICSASFSFATIQACDRQTDGRTDRQNYDSHNRPRICSRGKKRKKSLFEPPFLDLGVTYALHPQLVGKPVVDSMFVTIELFFAISYGRDVMSGNRSKSAFFEGAWVTLSADFRGNGVWPANHCWCQKTRVIAVSCDMKFSAVLHLVLSQCTRLIDRRTER